MNIKDLRILKDLLKEFTSNKSEEYGKEKSINNLLLEIDLNVKLEEYKMMVDYMDRQLYNHSNGYPTEVNFEESNFMLSFGTKTIQVGNCEYVFNTLREMLINEIDEIERWR